MKLQFLGAAHEVTGSCHYLEFGGRRLLVDCGMEQGPDLYVNQEVPADASEVDYIVITHAHIDHSGLLPLFYLKGFRGKVFATKATCELCSIMLKDSAHIQKFEAEWKNRKGRRAGQPAVEPLYGLKDVEDVMGHFVPCEYGTEISVEEGLRIRFVDAGHLLGSASVELWANEAGRDVKVVFSGDIGHAGKPLIKSPQFIEDADYVVMESTYGDRIHASMPDFAGELAKLIEDTFARGGNVVIPAFSVGRTQEMLYFLRKIKSERRMGRFLDFEVYLDSPLAIEATNIFHKNVADCFDEEALSLVSRGENPIGLDGLHIAVTSEESVRINFLQKPAVILSASGMCEAGRIRHHLKHNLWRQESSIVFVGFQAPGTLGSVLLSGAKEVKLFGEQISVRAKIVNLPGVSSHADKAHLTEWAAHIRRPKKIFVVHGEDSACDAFAAHLRQKLGVPAEAPYSGDCYDLLTGKQVAQGTKERAKQRGAVKSRAKSNAFAKLLAAGQRLLSVIRRSEGMPNKELGRFASQVNSLCDKWER